MHTCTGKSFVATTNDALTETHKVFAVPLKSNTGSGKGATSSALVQWTEVQHHPGLVCALSQATSNPVVLLIKPEQIQVHELKALPNKAKVQGMVAMRQAPTTGEPVRQQVQFFCVRFSYLLASPLPSLFSPFFPLSFCLP